MQRFTSRLLSARMAGAVVFLAILPTSSAFAQDLDRPLVAKSRDKQCEIEVRGKDSSFLVSAFGLVPGEKLAVTSESAGEVVRYTTSADPVGQYHFIEVPLVRGRQSGIARVTIAASRCRLYVSFPWRE